MGSGVMKAVEWRRNEAAEADRGTGRKSLKVVSR